MTVTRGCLLLPLLLLPILPGETSAHDKCITPEKAQMPDAPDLLITGTAFSVGFCYQPEQKKDGVLADNRDLIVLKKAGVAVAEQETRMPVTVGRIAELALEKSAERFVAVSYEAGEFCNGLVIFDTREQKVAAQQGCLSQTDICHVVALDAKGCSASLECKDNGGDGGGPLHKDPVTKTLPLCKK